MNKRLRQIEENIQTRKLLRRNESILIAVSGGLDSMVLLHLLGELSKTYRWRITVAHFNHRLRGRSSDADERLVQNTSATLKLKFVSDRAEVEKFAITNHLSIEMAARKLRHEFLARSAKKLKIKTVVLAHHADDQVELFFLRLLRGAGTEGLSGMSWKSKSPADSSIQLIRPLLDQSKAALTEIAQAKKIKFREDASNLSLDFQRNQVRHKVIPLLTTIQPGLSETILRTKDIVASESNFVLNAALAWLASKRRTPFDLLHVALQRVCVRLQIRALGFPGDFVLVERLRMRPAQMIALNPEYFVWRDKLGVVQLKKQTAIAFNSDVTTVDLTGTERIQFGGRRFIWAFQSAKGKFCSKRNCEFFDANKVGSKITLRHWKTGDRFQPIGTRSSRKLQDLFMDLKVPRTERHKRVVATNQEGVIFWVEGLRIGERFKLDNGSLRRLKWCWRNVFRGAVAGSESPC